MVFVMWFFVRTAANQLTSPNAVYLFDLPLLYLIIKILYIQNAVKRTIVVQLRKKERIYQVDMRIR